MTNPLSNQFLTILNLPINQVDLPDQFALMHNDPHPLCIIAAEDLQNYLNNQNDWNHNFGLSNDQEQAVIGKMFGVLVVRTNQDEIGYLAAFSGKLAGHNNHAKFVPPIFDTLAKNGFLNTGMQELTRMNHEISTLLALESDTDLAKLSLLKKTRKKYSVDLQQQIFDHYHLLNQAGEEKSLIKIFRAASYANPPAGAGECAGPKLLQHAFKNQLRPLALAEFWWGLSPKSATWKHKQFYPCCKEKCEPILAHMLKGLS